jgi:hypothetical protein
MKKLIFLFVVLLSFGDFAAATQAQAPATLTVNSFVSVTIDVCPAGGVIDYGGRNPNSSGATAAACQDSTNSAIKVTVEPLTNVPLDVSLSGSDYTGSGTATGSSIDVARTTYDDDATVGEGTETGEQEGTLTTSSTVYWNGIGGSGTEVVKEIWFWLTMPGTFLKAGPYESTYTINAS